MAEARTRFSRSGWRRVLIAGIALCAWGAALGGCASKVTTVDESLQPPGFPEGQPSEATSQLIVYRTTSTPISYYTEGRGTDRGPRSMPDTVFIKVTLPTGAVVDSGTSSADFLTAHSDTFAQPQGTIEGAIFDKTTANAFEVYRREGSGGYRQFKDFVIRPANRYLDAQVDYFTFSDRNPVAGAFPTYLGRGTLDGRATPNSPITNLGTASNSAVDKNLRFTAPREQIISPFGHPDSLFRLRWTSVPGATGYWVHLYQLDQTFRSVDQLLVQGAPAPIFNQGPVDYILIFFPGNVTEYRVSAPLPMGAFALINKYNQLLYGQEYRVRISAVDASGQMTGFLSKYGNYFISLGEGFYRAAPMGAVVVRALPPPSEGRPQQ